MTVVYIDSVFVLNMTMDYLILTAAAALAGVPVKRRRCLLAALLGGGYAAAVFLPDCGFLSAWFWKAAAGLAIAAAAYAGQQHFFRMALLAFAVSCGFAGCVLALGMLSGGLPMENGVFYTNVDAKVLLIAASAAYLLLSVVFRAGGRSHVRGIRVPVKITCGGCSVALTALCDTGNALSDPSTNQPVLVADVQRLQPLFPAAARPLLRQQMLWNPAEALETLTACCPALRLHLIPYRAVGVSGGLLLAFRSDWAEIGTRRFPHLLVALSPTPVGETFDALWGGEEGERYEKNLASHPPAAATDRMAPAAFGSLHWRQQHASAAAAPGSGGRTAGTAGQSRGAKNAD